MPTVVRVTQTHRFAETVRSALAEKISRAHGGAVADLARPSPRRAEFYVSDGVSREVFKVTVEAVG